MWCILDCSLGCPGDEEQEDEEDSVMLDMEFIQQHRVWSHLPTYMHSGSKSDRLTHEATGTVFWYLVCFCKLSSCMLWYVRILYVTATSPSCAFLHHFVLMLPTVLMAPICFSDWNESIETAGRMQPDGVGRCSCRQHHIVNQRELLIIPFYLLHIITSCLQPVQDALGSAPLVGDLAGIKAREEFVPSSKAEKHAARLHAEAGRLYNEEE